MTGSNSPRASKSFCISSLSSLWWRMVTFFPKRSILFNGSAECLFISALFGPTDVPGTAGAYNLGLLPPETVAILPAGKTVLSPECCWWKAKRSVVREHAAISLRTLDHAVTVTFEASPPQPQQLPTTNQMWQQKPRGRRAIEHAERAHPHCRLGSNSRSSFVKKLARLRYQSAPMPQNHYSNQCGRSST